MIVIQPRDRALLRSVFEHRFLTSEHVQYLHFKGRSLRAAQSRLKELVDAGYLTRTYVMPPIGVPARVRPLYSLALAGARLVAGDVDVPVSAVPHTAAANRRGYEHLLHELVVTDFLIAASASLVDRGYSVAMTRDHDLRARLAHQRSRSERGVVPDGALTLVGAELPPTTLYLEVVHSGVKAGNARLIDKLTHYVALNRAHYFERVFGHARIRGVLIVSLSARRAEHLRALADRRLVHGRRFAGFVVAPRHLSRTHPPTTFTPETLPVVVDLDGAEQSFSPALFI